MLSITKNGGKTFRIHVMLERYCHFHLHFLCECVCMFVHVYVEVSLVAEVCECTYVCL